MIGIRDVPIISTLSRLEKDRNTIFPHHFLFLWGGCEKHLKYNRQDAKKSRKNGQEAFANTYMTTCPKCLRGHLRFYHVARSFVVC